GIARHDDLVAWTDPEPAKRGQQGRGARVDRDRVANPTIIGDLPLHLVDFPLETRVYFSAKGDAIAEEVAATQHLQDFLDLFLANQVHSRSRHIASSPFLLANRRKRGQDS